MEIKKAFDVTEPLLEDQNLTAVQVLERCKAGTLRDWIVKKREPKFTVWDSKTTSLRAHIGALEIEAGDSGCSDDQLRSGFVLTTTGMAKSIADTRVKTDSTVTAKELMEETLRAVENNITDTDETMLDSIAQASGETTDKLAERIIEGHYRILSTRGITEKSEIERRSKRVFCKALKDPIGSRVRAAFPETWNRATEIARQVEGEIGVYNEARIGAMGGGRGRGKGNWQKRGGQGGGSQRGGGQGGGGGGRRRRSCGQPVEDLLRLQGDWPHREELPK